MRSTSLDARRAQRPLGRASRGRGCGRAARRRRTRPRTAPRPPARPRSSTARSPGRSRRATWPPSARDALRDDPAEQAAPARVQHRDRRRVAVRRARARSAGSRRVIASIGQVGLVGPEPVARLAARAGARRGGRALECTCRLSASRSGVGADLGAEPAAVLVDALDVVAGHPAEVERGVRALADAALARRERRPRTGPAPPSGSRAAPARALGEQPARGVFSSGSLDDLVEQRPQRAAERRPWRKPTAIRSSPSTARSASRCGCSRSCSTSVRRSASSASPSSAAPARSCPAGRPRLCASRSSASRSPWRARKRRASTRRRLAARSRTGARARAGRRTSRSRVG